jgi:hypothetical protein
VSPAALDLDVLKQKFANRHEDYPRKKEQEKKRGLYQTAPSYEIERLAVIWPIQVYLILLSSTPAGMT